MYTEETLRALFPEKLGAFNTIVATSSDGTTINISAVTETRDMPAKTIADVSYFNISHNDFEVYHIYLDELLDIINNIEEYKKQIKDYKKYAIKYYKWYIWTWKLRKKLDCNVKSFDRYCDMYGALYSCLPISDDGNILSPSSMRIRIGRQRPQETLPIFNIN